MSVAAPGAGSDAEVVADVDGRDKEILLERGAEVLKALEHLAFRALRLEPEHHEKIHIDCGGYRALRFEELRMTAKVAAERVQSSKQPFRLNPMTSRERRIVHLALKDIPGVRTESIGVGEQRQVVIHPADNKRPRSSVACSRRCTRPTTRLAEACATWAGPSPAIATVPSAAKRTL